jgi:hypothetical protein
MFFLVLILAAQTACAGSLTPAEQSFQAGEQAYRTADFTKAAQAFQTSATEKPAAGTCQNLGNAEWQRGRVGPAILAWERALWLSPADHSAHASLDFARSTGQIDSPELTWYEGVSTWLPSGWWALLTAFSLWLVADLLALPGIFRRRRTGWQQALAAIGLTLLLLTLPAHVGWHTRSKIGFVLEPNTPLRLTPTEQAQEITRVGAGEPGRCERTSGNYCYIRFRNTAGWLTREEFGMVAGK